MTGRPEDDALLEKITKVEREIFETCDLIPIQCWGFDEQTQQKLRQRKHNMVNQQLSKKKIRMNKSAKGAVARSFGVNETISGVFDWLSLKGINLQLKAAKLEKPQSQQTNGESLKKQKQPLKEPKEPAEHSSSDDDSSDEESPNNIVEKPKLATKPIAAVKPTVRADKENFNDKMDDDDDSVDEETQEVDLKGKGGQKRKVVANVTSAAKKTKLDKELEKFEKVDPSSLDPIESRRVALLKLQKKLQNFKLSRVGNKADGNGKKVTDAAAEKKLKRRMSKLQLKQRRAEEKQKVNVGQNSVSKGVKSEGAEEIRNDNGEVVYSKFDFIVKEDKKKRLSTSEKKEKFTGKDYRSLLHKAEKRNEKLAELKEIDPEKAKQMEEDIKWNRALKKAEGVKVKDNVELLKRGLRKKEKSKEKRLAKWDHRVDKVKGDKEKRQEKRFANIAKRAEDKKKKKMTKLRKKGRIL